MTYHLPVLLQPLLAAAGRPSRAVDATLGDGGHAEALLSTGAEVLGIDRDPDAIAIARRRLGTERMHYLEASFASDEARDAAARFAPDLVLLDLGASSRQLDEDPRGFSFRPGAPLDMRMSATGRSAADFLNGVDETTLVTTFVEYGDEPRARRLAGEIRRRRERKPFLISDDFVNAIRAVLGPQSGPPDFARLFQAVRIAVNEELGGLESALPAFRDALVPGGLMAVISYHSGEDRVVKHAFQEWSRRCICPPGQPVCTCRGRRLGRAEPRRPILPDAEEIAANPRARSAKLRLFRVDDAA
jgi:16S rRNA (cytosine1402-N4)-methyltransferase